MGDLTLTRSFRGKDVTAHVTSLAHGVHVLLTGGDKSHVGAVAIAQNGVPVHSFALPSHREKELAEHWAAELSKVYAEATVACGIHYENITKAEIDGVLAVCETLLNAI